MLAETDLPRVGGTCSSLIELRDEMTAGGASDGVNDGGGSNDTLDSSVSSRQPLRRSEVELLRMRL